MSGKDLSSDLDLSGRAIAPVQFSGFARSMGYPVHEPPVIYTADALRLCLIALYSR
jgi:hypothetical protein